MSRALHPPPPFMSCLPFPLLPIAAVTRTRTRTGLALLVALALFAPGFATALAVAEPDPRALDIERGPAPPPEEGPPLSRNASRDRSLLGAQVGAIVGAWLVFVTVLGCYLAFIGRRLRANALGGPPSRDLEMVKTAPNKQSEPSPTSSSSKDNSPSSPNKAGSPNFSWPSPTKQTFGSTMAAPAPAPFDERVLQDDREQRERDMERLYAAVMEQDASGSAPANGGRAPKPEPLRPNAGEEAGRGSGLSLKSLRSPKLLRALTSPVSKSPDRKSGSKEDERRPSASSQNTAAPSSPSSDRRRGSIRGMKISKPIPTPTFSLHSRGQASDEEPLTPRYPPPTPPNPGSQPPTPPYQQYTAAQRAPSHAPGASVGSIDSITARRAEPTIQLAKPRARAGPTGANAAHSRSGAGGGAPVSPPRSPPPGAGMAPLTSAASSTSTLAIRTHSDSPQPSHALPLRSLDKALGTQRSANATKVTVVERPEHLRATEGTGVPPRTGVAVPYSPFYMPYTPVTPITPGLVSRRERKAREKAEAVAYTRAGGNGGTAGGGIIGGALGSGKPRRAVTEMVRSDDEIWDSAY